MKWSIYLLLLANLLVAAWWYPPGDSVEQSPPAPPLPPGTERLVLLAEQDAQVLAETEQPAPEAPQQQAADAAAPAPVEPEVSEPLPDLVQIPFVPEPIPVPETALATESEAPAEDAAQPEPPAPRTEPEPVIACLSVGPFTDEAGARALRERLTAIGLDPQQRSETVQQPAGYWVYLSARPLDEARTIVEDLRHRGVEDYFIGRQNFISLGIFTDRTTAERRREEIEKYGYEPQVEQRFRATSRYWLDLEVPEPDLPGEAQWNDWLGQYPDVSLRGDS